MTTSIKQLVMEPSTSLAAQRSSLEEQQRQVIVRACEMCRKKKIRCEPTMQGCAQCTKYSTSCHFTPISMRKKNRRPANFKYMAQLEERLLKMEALFGDQLRGKSAVPDDSSPKGQTTISRPSPSSTGALSPPHDHSIPWTPEIGPFSQPAPQQLPTKVVALELVKETLSGYNKFLPIFDEENFLHEFQLKYATSNPGDAGWWACINVVLSLAYRLRALRTSDPTDANARAGGYFQNALAVVSELSISYRSLAAVQALVGMASILQGTSNPIPSSVLAAVALRLAQNMDLHRECSNSGLTASQAEQRRRVFWMAYILDKDISLRLMRPFSQDDDDMDVHLPSKMRHEISEHETEICPVSLLNYRIGLAIIQGQVYKQLYSTQAKQQAESQRAIAARELNSSLSYWKSIAQPELPAESTRFSGVQLSGVMIHKVVLRLTYIHCLAMIDRHLPPMIQPSLGQEPSQSVQLLYLESACLSESRQAIRLLDLIPHRDCACVWMLLHAFFAAASSILYNLTLNPTSPQAQSDVHLVKPFLRLLEALAGDQRTWSPSVELGRMIRICNNLNNEANAAVQLFGISTINTMET